MDCDAQHAYLRPLFGGQF